MKNKWIKRLYPTLCLVFFVSSSGISQVNTIRYDLYSLSVDGKLEAFNRKVSPFAENDIKGIRLSADENDGIAWLKHIIFTNGTIELDIRGKSENPSFAGVAFHGIDNKTFDAVYFRPFNFKSPDSVHRIHAVQYISMPDYPWEALRDKFNARYEKEIIPAPDGDDWFHVKIIIKASQISVFVNGYNQPCLDVEKLNNRSTGKIGLWVGNGSDGDFANLQISGD